MRVGNEVGRFGEQIAVRHLRAHGIAVLDRNWRCRFGEIDIIGQEGNTLVFCEVKTRRGQRCGRPAEAVVTVKAERLRSLALRWLAETGRRSKDLRFDVIEVVLCTRTGTHVAHLRGVL